MPLYRYEALDRNGNNVVGAMQVPDEHTVATRLVGMGYQPVAILPAAAGAGRPARAAGGAVAGAAASGGSASPLSAPERELARTFHQLHLSFKAGMPAYQAFSTVAGQTHHRAMRTAVFEISEGIREGNPISLMMEGYPHLFSRGDVGMVRAAEQGGFLPEALEALAVQHEQDDNTRRRLNIWVWFFHSGVVTLALVIALSQFFKPAIESGFQASVGYQAVTRTFLTVTLPLLAFYTLGVIGFTRLRRHPAFARKWHRQVLRLPVVGKINRLRCNSVFTRVLQQLYRAGIPPVSAWDTASGAVPNLFLSDRFSEGRPVVENTARFSLAMQQVGEFEPTDVGMVATGETTGEVAQALDYLADHYEEDTRIALGASVMRGAMFFSLWAVAFGLAALAVFQWSYLGQLVPSVMKGMGVE